MSYTILHHIISYYMMIYSSTLYDISSSWPAVKSACRPAVLGGRSAPRNADRGRMRAHTCAHVRVHVHAGTYMWVPLSDIVRSTCEYAVCTHMHAMHACMRTQAKCARVCVDKRVLVRVTHKAQHAFTLTHWTTRSTHLRKRTHMSTCVT